MKPHEGSSDTCVIISECQRSFEDLTENEVQMNSNSFIVF